MRMTIDEFRQSEDPDLACLAEWLELIDTVCGEEAVSRPEVEFREDGNGRLDIFDDGGLCIRLPHPNWAVEYDPECIPSGCYRLLVLHELAHLIDYQRNKKLAHSPFMYAKLFQLVLRHGLDLQWALEDERKYKPRAAMRGWNLFRQWSEAAT